MTFVRRLQLISLFWFNDFVHEILVFLHLAKTNYPKSFIFQNGFSFIKMKFDNLETSEHMISIPAIQNYIALNNC